MMRIQSAKEHHRAYLEIGSGPLASDNLINIPADIYRVIRLGLEASLAVMCSGRIFHLGLAYGTARSSLNVPALVHTSVIKRSPRERLESSALSRASILLSSSAFTSG